jgi:arabinan endo-1,5-alpha-L-arabinosidase
VKYLWLLLAACGGPGDRPRADAPAPIDDVLVADVAPVPDAPPTGPVTLDLAGAITPVHDPSIISVDGFYYVFSTGTGLPIRTSLDLVNWSLDGQVFATAPSWITTSDSANPNNLWAPDISFFNGTYHLYYAASTFGSRDSCIGHATTSNPGSNAWTDQGAVICSTTSDDWNAIDPAAFVDADGNAWLAFGSFWSGLELVPLDANGMRAGTEMFALATRANQAVEAAYVVHHDGDYFLFESVDFCCQGVASTYKIMVGRSSDVRGPYVDANGEALLAGAGTLLVEGDERWRGPGHNAVISTPTGDFNIYHSYDANAGGTPTLRISQLRWGSDGWPTSAGP